MMRIFKIGDTVSDRDGLCGTIIGAQNSVYTILFWGGVKRFCEGIRNAQDIQPIREIGDNQWEFDTESAFSC